MNIIRLFLTPERKILHERLANRSAIPAADTALVIESCDQELSLPSTSTGFCPTSTQHTTTYSSSQQTTTNSREQDLQDDVIEIERQGLRRQKDGRENQNPCVDDDDENEEDDDEQ